MHQNQWTPFAVIVASIVWIWSYLILVLAVLFTLLSVHVWGVRCMLLRDHRCSWSSIFVTFYDYLVYGDLHVWARSIVWWRHVVTHCALILWYIALPPISLRQLGSTVSRMCCSVYIVAVILVKFRIRISLRIFFSRIKMSSCVCTYLYVLFLKVQINKHTFEFDTCVWMYALLHNYMYTTCTVNVRQSRSPHPTCTSTCTSLLCIVMIVFDQSVGILMFLVEC